MRAQQYLIGAGFLAGACFFLWAFEGWWRWIPAMALLIVGWRWIGDP